MNREVYIVYAKRSPIGKLMGSLSSLSAVEIGTEVVRDILAQLRLMYGNEVVYDIDEVIVGNVLSCGLGQNPARQILIQCHLPNQIGGFTVNKVCGSGMKAIICGAQAIQLGEADLVICGGIESMTNAPHFINLRKQHKFGDVNLVDTMVYDGLIDVYSNKLMGEWAEFLAEELKVSRQEQDEWSFISHKRAIKATKEGLFKNEIVPITIKGKRIEYDEGPREDTTIEKLSALAPFFKKDGTITPGNASQISDGAAFVVLAGKNAVDEHHLKPIAKIVGYSSSGLEPKWLFLTPEVAIYKLLKNINLSLEEIELIEINEAFAAQIVALKKKMNIQESKLNVNGGAIALGHPLGCSGARIVVTLVHALKNYNKKKGIASLCMGGGNGLAIAVEAIEN
ncbi:MAG: thiolase family protein [Planctomycetota bacterium]